MLQIYRDIAEASETTKDYKLPNLPATKLLTTKDSKSCVVKVVNIGGAWVQAPNKLLC